MHTFLIAMFGAASLTTACSSGAGSGDDENSCTANMGDLFSVGLEKIGDKHAIDVKLMSANPAPPERDDNTWVIQLNAVDAGVVGEPISDATIHVVPVMPGQHGTPIEVLIHPMAEAGMYELSPINMWMGGIWEVTINVTSGDVTDRVTYRFCIPS